MRTVHHASANSGDNIGRARPSFAVLVEARYWHARNKAAGGTHYLLVYRHRYAATLAWLCFWGSLSLSFLCAAGYSLWVTLFTTAGPSMAPEWALLLVAPAIPQLYIDWSGTTVWLPKQSIPRRGGTYEGVLVIHTIGKSFGTARRAFFILGACLFAALMMSLFIAARYGLLVAFAVAGGLVLWAVYQRWKWNRFFS